MADDTFEREVNEQIRQDRAQELWNKYGKYIIGLAVLIVAGTAALTGWNYYRETTAAGFGDRYMEALELSASGRQDEADALLNSLSQEGSGQYPALAEMRIAGELADRGDKAEALGRFDAIAADSSFNPVFRQIATLRAGLLAVDLEDFSSVENRLSALAEPGSAFRHSAREALAIAALKAGEDQKALAWLTRISEDAAAPNGVRARSGLLLDMLAGKGVTADG